jgi:hypothetical protein
MRLRTSILPLRYKRSGMMSATCAGSWVIIPKNGRVDSACSFIQNKRFVVVVPIDKEVGEAVHAHQRLWMLMPEPEMSTSRPEGQLQLDDYPLEFSGNLYSPSNYFDRLDSTSNARLGRLVDIYGPSTVSCSASVCLFIASVASYLPWLSSTPAKLLIVASVDRCSRPSTVSLSPIQSSPFSRSQAVPRSWRLFSHPYATSFGAPCTMSNTGDRDRP